MKTKFFVPAFVLLIMFSTFSKDLYAAVKFYQSNQINKDGSITLNIVYSAKKSNLTENKMIGNLPFSEDAIQEMFSSSDSKIEKNTVYIDPKDENIIGVNVRISIPDINKIPGIKAFKDFKTVWSNEGSEMLFKWNVPVSFMKDNLVDTYQFILKSEDEVKSSNGVLKDNAYDWFIFADKIDPKGALFTASITATENNNKNTTSSETNVGAGEDNTMQDDNLAESDNDETDTEEKKSCGVFSIELPFIILLGTSMSYVLRKRKKK